MKKFSLILMTVAMLIISASTCAAKDVWVESWQSEGTDIYVMDDTIKGNNSYDYFSVTVKKVRNGQLLQTVIWKFSQVRGDFWRYETSTMDGTHTTVVMPRNKIFEFGMGQLGWSYRIENNYYY